MNHLLSSRIEILSFKNLFMMNILVRKIK